MYEWYMIQFHNILNWLITEELIWDTLISGCQIKISENFQLYANFLDRFSVDFFLYK